MDNNFIEFLCMLTWKYVVFTQLKTLDYQPGPIRLTIHAVGSLLALGIIKSAIRHSSAGGTDQSEAR